jgi:hypothetical protein
MNGGMNQALVVQHVPNCREIFSLDAKSFRVAMWSNCGRTILADDVTTVPHLFPTSALHIPLRRRRYCERSPLVANRVEQVIWLHATVRSLLIEMRKCVAQRRCGDLEYAVERPVHLGYEEYGTTDRQGANEEHIPSSTPPSVHENTIIPTYRQEWDSCCGFRLFLVAQLYDIR